MLFILSILVAIGAFVAWQAARKSAGSNTVARGSSAIFGAASLLFTLVAFSQAFTVVPAGHVGIVDFFGTVADKTLAPGINFVNPMANVVTYSAQTKEHKENMQVLSREGLTIGLELSVLYRLNPDSAASIYKKIFGGDYEDVILVPQFRSISRAVTASFQASALYSTERERLSESVQAELAKVVGVRGIVVEATPLRNVALPTQLTEAIEQKQRADQESQHREMPALRAPLRIEPLAQGFEFGDVDFLDVGEVRDAALGVLHLLRDLAAQADDLDGFGGFGGGLGARQGGLRRAR